MNLDNGFLIVASQLKRYAVSANICAGSIKDNYPEAHITLFVTEELLPFVDKTLFDNIVYQDVPSHTRTKLYALSRTPYKKLTVYVDADMECCHQDVSTIWNEIPDNVDILMTKIRPYNGKISKWDGGQMIHHGGFFIYRTNEKTLDFMSKWWDNYVTQTQSWTYTEYPIALQPWDQFTFWKLLTIDKADVVVDFFNDDARWNFVNGYRLTENKKPIIFYHHTVRH